jgi:hypothetical protein
MAIAQPEFADHAVFGERRVDAAPDQLLDFAVCDAARHDFGYCRFFDRNGHKGILGAAESERQSYAAKSHVASTVDQVSGSMEKALDDLLSRTSVPATARPIIMTTVQLLLVAALETVLPKPVR